MRRDTVRDRAPDKLTGDDRPVPAYSPALLDRLADLETGDPITVTGKVIAPLNQMFQLADCSVE